MDCVPIPSICDYGPPCASTRERANTSASTGASASASRNYVCHVKIWKKVCKVGKA